MRTVLKAIRLAAIGTLPTGGQSRKSSLSALPEPMLARAETTLPVGDYAFEVKWDGSARLSRHKMVYAFAAAAAGT